MKINKVDDFSDFGCISSGKIKTIKVILRQSVKKKKVQVMVGQLYIIWLSNKSYARLQNVERTLEIGLCLLIILLNFISVIKAAM